MTDSGRDRLDQLVDRLREFNRERDWEQFHTLRSLVLALISEVGELAAEVRWHSEDVDDGQNISGDQRARLEAEIGDVLLIVLNICGRLGVDPVGTATKKLDANTVLYPVARSRGRPDRPA